MVPAGDAAIETLTGRDGLTMIDTGFDVAGLPVTQTASDVIEHVTTSPLSSVLLMNVALFTPAAVPFTNHA